jgi:hypothetical protein
MADTFRRIAMGTLAVAAAVLWLRAYRGVHG